MCHAPAPSHHRCLPRANSCRAMCVLTPQLPPFAIAHLTPDSLSILSLPTFHHSPATLAVPLSFPHWPYPILATFLSMACVLKRFPLTSPRKLALTCVKRGFLRTAEPHRTSQLSPCSPMMSQCHVSMLCLAVMCHAPAPSHHRLLSRANSCRALFPNPTAHTLRNRTSDPDTLSILSLLASLHSPYSHSLTLSLHFPSLCRHHTGPIKFYPRVFPWRA